ncbi:hypothetical protein [Aurantiacibacter rhizosphaerae]|uniref:HEAT repeat domain-containing protein n=1 Tax=Aurantiacibacter rhizosphaerae TaxID=2691582 RepID=A0A844XG49_9SPHN|nr:hypothetical protein [Aurantiacibacter rhizosphaerae]MWV28548.1 hypothetical protein [Aurantiacibacter rhizosphaerae]
MLVHPDIAALRSDRAPQRQAQAGMQAARDGWSAEPGAAQMQEELKAYGKGAPLAACPVLEAVFTQVGEAERLMASLSAHYCRALAQNPIGHPQFRNGFNGTSTSLLLAQTGRAQLLLQAREPGDSEAASYNFCDATRFDALLAGSAQARMVRKRQVAEDIAVFDEERLSLHPGNRLAFDLNHEALAIDRVEKRAVFLRLLRTADDPAPAREYDAASGRLLHQSSGKISTSRREAIVALLGRMGREDAAPAIAQIAMDEGDVSLRWQAMREALALDTCTGFRALITVARRPQDPLAAQAGALRAQLLETYPQLQQLEAEECPA